MMNHDLLIADNHFSTDDFVLAGVLALFYPVAAVDRNDLLGPCFVFQRYASMVDVIELYRCGELTVEPRAYAAQLHRLEMLATYA